MLIRAYVHLSCISSPVLSSFVPIPSFDAFCSARVYVLLWLGLVLELLASMGDPAPHSSESVTLLDRIAKRFVQDVVHLFLDFISLHSLPFFFLLLFDFVNDVVIPSFFIQ